MKVLMIDSEAAYEQSFGGLFYVFLRTLSCEESERHGVHFERPDWTDILNK